MRIENNSGLRVDLLPTGSIKSIEADPIRISMMPANAYSRNGANLYLRLHSDSIQFIPLLGPQSLSEFCVTNAGFFFKGIYHDLYYKGIFRLSETGTSWNVAVEVENTSTADVKADLVYLQDVGLKQATAGLVNEYYVSQYVERRIFADVLFGKVVVCRQNMKEPTGNPWLMIACSNGADSACTDGMVFYGKSFRETSIPEALNVETLLGEYAGESSLVALQSKPANLKPGQGQIFSFSALFMHNHSEASSGADLSLLSGLFASFREQVALPENSTWFRPERNLFNMSPFLLAETLSETELKSFFEPDWRHIEKNEDSILSFFCGNNNHVVLKEKELLVDRPHGIILQANLGLTPHEGIVSTNPYLSGVFNSHFSQGNTNFNVLLSVHSGQFNLGLETGQRIFVNINGQYHLLGVPSAFEMGLSHCRWIYKHEKHIFEILTKASVSSPEVSTSFKVLEGEKVEVIITHDFDHLNGWQMKPGHAKEEFIATPFNGAMITSKFPDAKFRMKIKGDYETHTSGHDEILNPAGSLRDKQLFVVKLTKTSIFTFSFIAEVNAPSQINLPEAGFAGGHDSEQFWNQLGTNIQLKGENPNLAAISEILPWYGTNALIHYLTPYGLEQFSGAAWGTRDVSQGPIDLLMSLGKYHEARQVLRIIFSNQHPDGWWSQWWMFDSYAHIRAHEAHGDIGYWCILALCNYIKTTGDFNILHEKLPYFNGNGTEGKAETTPLCEHVERLIQSVINSFIPGFSFVPFGGGDWNDSLQPVSNDLARRMISSWTVLMSYQAFLEYKTVCQAAGFISLAEHLTVISKEIKSDFNKYLIADGVVAGYGLVESKNHISLLLHPSDKITGVKYSVLPMNRGIISNLFTPEQAAKHYTLIVEHLTGPDGVRLMDRPLKYKGGIQKIFQRAESSTFFGREIGLMYNHEHIRYAETLAILGNAEEFIKALRQASPVDYNQVVVNSTPRQANCYYSSSDVVFKSRYEADKLYGKVISGEKTVRGGWRVYSSGPGIYIGLVVGRMLGLRLEYDQVIIDPVVPVAFNGFSARLQFLGKQIEILYTIAKDTHSPKSIRINGNVLDFKRQENIYRPGGAMVPKVLFLASLEKEENLIEIAL
jgi:cellobiose phosphorylase